MTEIKADIDLVAMARKIDRIEQAVLGNGVKGLCQRVEDLEKNEKSGSKIIGIAAGFGAVIGSVFTFVMSYFKA